MVGNVIQINISMNLFSYILRYLHFWTLTDDELSLVFEFEGN